MNRQMYRDFYSQSNSLFLSLEMKSLLVTFLVELIELSDSWKSSSFFSLVLVLLRWKFWELSTWNVVELLFSLFLFSF